MSYEQDPSIESTFQPDAGLPRSVFYDRERGSAGSKFVLFGAVGAIGLLAAFKGIPAFVGELGNLKAQHIDERTNVGVEGAVVDNFVLDQACIGGFTSKIRSKVETVEEFYPLGNLSDKSQQLGSRASEYNGNIKAIACYENKDAHSSFDPKERKLTVELPKDLLLYVFPEKVADPNSFKQEASLGMRIWDIGGLLANGVTSTFTALPYMESGSDKTWSALNGMAMLQALKFAGSNCSKAAYTPEFQKQLIDSIATSRVKAFNELHKDIDPISSADVVVNAPSLENVHFNTQYQDEIKKLDEAMGAKNQQDKTVTRFTPPVDKNDASKNLIKVNDCTPLPADQLKDAKPGQGQ
jgi:hypothetical protein